MKFSYLSSLIISLPLYGLVYSGYANATSTPPLAHPHYSDAAKRVEGLPTDVINSLLEAEAMLSAGQHQAAAQRYLDAAKKTGSLNLLNSAAAALDPDAPSRLDGAIAQEWLKDYPDGIHDHTPPTAPMASALMHYYAQQGKWLQALNTGLWLDNEGHSPNLAMLTSSAMDANANPDEYAQVLNQYIKKTPDHLQPLLARALVTLKQGQTQQALTQINSIEKRWPKAPDAWVAESQIQLSLNDTQKALAAIQHAHSLNPQEPRYLFSTIQLQLYLGQSQNAINSANDLLAKLNNPVLLRNQLGRLFLEAHQPALAEQLIKPNTTTNPPDTDAQLLMAGAAEEQQQWTTAVARYSQIDEKSPAFIASRVRAAQLLLTHQSQKAALDYLASQQEKFPQQRQLFTELSVSMLDELDQQAQASALLDKEIAAAQGNDDDLLMLRAERNISLKHPAEAERDLKVLLQRNPNDANVLNTYGYTLTLFTKRYPEAQQVLEKANRISPNNPAIMDSLGWTYAKMNQLPLARMWLERAYAQDQEDEISTHLASVLIELNNRQQAQKIVAKGYQQLKSHPMLSELVSKHPWLDTQHHSSSPVQGAVSR